MRLKPRYREVVLLYYYQGLTLREIALVLGISGPAVSKRLKKARSNLYFALKGEEPYDITIRPPFAPPSIITLSILTNAPPCSTRCWPPSTAG
jgi:hypothetical protein